MAKPLSDLKLNVTVTKLRGKHERIGRHEGSVPMGYVEFAPHVTDAEQEAFKREWKNQRQPRGEK